jgi:hypothetical protein
MKSFIRAIEVWVPSRDRQTLEFGAALYGNATHMAAGSRSLVFGRGEGLPGQAWEQQRPLVLKQLEGSYFRRARAARADGLTCGMAVPVFAGDFLSAVLLMFCGDDAEHAGAIELWHNDPRLNSDMALEDGYYGSTGDAFEMSSRRTLFRRGTGLPGMAWESDAPVFIEDLGKSARFLRADSATRVGINRGFAIPCPVPGDEHYVMAFLSALGTPIARRVETWKPDAAREHLHLDGGFCEYAGLLAAGARPALERGQGTIGGLLLTGIPGVSAEAAGEPGGVGAAAAAAGLSSLVAMPVVRHGRLVAAVAWYF